MFKNSLVAKMIQSVAITNYADKIVASNAIRYSW